MKFQSVKFKISILYTITLGLLLTAYSTFLYVTLSRELGQDLDMELKFKTQQIKAFVDEFYQQTFREGEDVYKTLNKAVYIAINLDKFQSDEVVLQATGNDWLRSFDRLDLSQDFIYFVDMEERASVFALFMGISFSSNLAYSFSKTG